MISTMSPSSLPLISNPPPSLHRKRRTASSSIVVLVVTSPGINPACRILSKSRIRQYAPPTVAPSARQVAETSKPTFLWVTESNQLQLLSETSITHLKWRSPLFLSAEWTERSSFSTSRMGSVKSELLNQILELSEGSPKAEDFTVLILHPQFPMSFTSPASHLKSCPYRNYTVKWVMSTTTTYAKW